MHRLGHSSAAAALRYQHKVDGQDRAIAALLGQLAFARTGPDTFRVAPTRRATTAVSSICAVRADGGVRPYRALCARVSPDELSRAASRRRQALAVISDLGLIDRWSQVGRAVVVGAVAYDLVVSPDIDLEVFTDGAPVIRKGFEVAAQLAEHPRVKRVRFTNALASADRGIYWQLRCQSEDGGDWKIDVWMLANEHAGPLSAWMVEPMRRALTPESRRSILTLKEARARGEVGAVASIDIYRAVLDGGVSTSADLHEFLGSGYVPALTAWLPSRGA